LPILSVSVDIADHTANDFCRRTGRVTSDFTARQFIDQLTVSLSFSPSYRSISFPVRNRTIHNKQKPRNTTIRRP
jgi:hypothetical protein